MRRGFKSWCERASTEYRQAADVRITEAFDPQQLAEMLGVQVCAPSEIPGVRAASLMQLTVIDPGSWSAISLVRREAKLVILNSSQSKARQANSLAHELAHIILNHRTDEALVSAEGFLFRAKFDREQEDEANWLAGAILVPREGLRRAYGRTPEPRHLAARFQVSEDLINWRVRMTGVARQMSYMRR